MKISFIYALLPHFYLIDTDRIARKLLGKLLVKREENNQFTAGMIVETEAYIPNGDSANHSASGKTQRNAAMHEQGGILYVYKIYGVHYCTNVVTESYGLGSAVLLRALEPVEGIELMKSRRNSDNITELCKGPGNLSCAMGLDKSNNFASLLTDNLFIQDYKSLKINEISETGRIGISKAADLKLRFFIADSKYVSRGSHL